MKHNEWSYANYPYLSKRVATRTKEEFHYPTRQIGEKSVKAIILLSTIIAALTVIFSQI